MLCELVESLIIDGFKRVFLINGHGGNHELAQLAARDTALRDPVKVAAGSYWNVAWPELIAAGAHSGRRLPGHAGDFESSMMLAIPRDLVPAVRPHRDGEFDTDPTGAQPVYRIESHGFWGEIDGFTDSPDRATADRGALSAPPSWPARRAYFTEFYRC